MAVNESEKGNGATQGPLADPTAPSSVGDWVRQNGVQVAIIAALIVAICRFLHPLDVLIAGIGLSLIVFIHELGHFVAAKWCDVHVKTFSIGFGPALPFCHFKYGETTYKLALIPLGGYVAMVGEGEEMGGDTPPTEEVGTDPADDPRSFVNKSVGQRMLIISAGVIMNILLGAVCFAFAYMHGVQEKPAICAQVEPGSAAWTHGVHSGTEITQLDGRTKPWFDDIRPVVSSTSRGETVEMLLTYQNQQRTVQIEPLRQEGALFPQLGVLSPSKPVLRHLRRDTTPPFLPGSPAARATGPDGGPGFLPGDRIIAMTDPAKPESVTPLDANWNQLPGEIFDFHRRHVDLAGQPITYHVVRRDDTSNTPVPIRVEPAFHYSLGLRMRMGPVAAVRLDSPAAQAGVLARRAGRDDTTSPGDRIVSVEVSEKDGSKTLFSNDPPVEGSSASQKPLDPLRLPRDLEDWSARTGADRKPVIVTVLREVDHTEKRVPLSMNWDASWRYEITNVSGPGTPLPVSGLGLAYYVQTVVDAVEPGSPAAAAGVQPGDRVQAVRFQAIDLQGEEKEQSWEEVQPHQWAFVDSKLQLQAPHKLALQLDRKGATEEVTLAARPDPTFPLPDRGFVLMNATQTQQASGLWDALMMGVDRTTRSIKTIYLGLYSMVFGRISVKLMSGPITLARASYIIAGEDFWTLLLWLGLISINLAVVNFLPIPVLDGGHMVFLIYEWLRGKPAPESVQAALTYLGLAMILCLMLFVIGLDIWRLFFG